MLQYKNNGNGREILLYNIIMSFIDGLRSAEDVSYEEMLHLTAIRFSISIEAVDKIYKMNKEK